MSRVRHVVLFRFKPDAPASAGDEMFAALRGLLGKIPGLLEYSGGTYSSPEGFHKGYTHGFSMTFADEASRNDYLPHPLHREAVDRYILPYLDGGLDGVVAFDWLESENILVLGSRSETEPAARSLG